MQLRTACTLASSLILSPLVARAAVLQVPADFPTIQQAVNAAAPGDVVRVATGVYQEHVRVDDGQTGLTIESADDANPATVAGKPNTSSDGIRIDGVNGVVLRGLRIQSANDCVRLNRVHGARLEGLELLGCRLGIDVNQGSGSTIVGVHVVGTRDAQGIFVDGADGTTVTDTVVTHPAREGIVARNASGLILLRTVVTGSRGGDGLRVVHADGPRIEACRLDANRRDGLRISDSPGLVLLDCTANANGSIGLRIALSPPYASVADVLGLGNTASGKRIVDVRVVPKKCNRSVCPPATLPTNTTTTTATTRAPTRTTTTTAPEPEPEPEVLESWRMYVRMAADQAREMNVDVPRTGDAPIDVAIPQSTLPAFRVGDQVTDDDLVQLGGPGLVARFADAASAWLASQPDRHPGASVVAIVWVKRTS